MRIILDTHVWLWFYLGDQQLSAHAKRFVTDPTNELLLGAASYWELAIKISTGKYKLLESFEEFIQHSLVDNDIRILPIESRHVIPLTSLPFHHKDPFDRLLVSQALVEAMPIVSADAILDAYGVERIW